MQERKMDGCAHARSRPAARPRPPAIGAPHLVESALPVRPRALSVKQASRACTGVHSREALSRSPSRQNFSASSCAVPAALSPPATSRRHRLLFSRPPMRLWVDGGALTKHCRATALAGNKEKSVRMQVPASALRRRPPPVGRPHGPCHGCASSHRTIKSLPECLPKVVQWSVQVQQTVTEIMLA